MHADPITHAAQYTDRLGAEADALQAAEFKAGQEIWYAFDSFYSGATSRRVSYVGCGPTQELRVQTQFVKDAITDALTDGEPKAALIALLQGTGDVDTLRKALCDDYIRRNADSIAQQRVVFDAPSVHSFLFQEA